MNYDYSNNFPQQPNWNQPPPAPEKRPTPWGRWIILALVIGIFVTGLIVLVANAGRKFGETIGDVSKNSMGLTDSLQAISINENYDSVYALIERDSTFSDLKGSIDILRNSTDSIIQLMNNLQRGFNDTIKDASALSRFDRAWAHSYFIKTHRALKLKQVLYAYRESEIEMLPSEKRDSSLRSYLLLDELSKTMPSFLKKLGSWENIYFNQPAMNVNINFKAIKSQVRDFEREILSRYKNTITGNNGY